MTVTDIMQQLESLGSAQTKKVFLRHGAREPFFGVKVEDMKKIIKEIKKVSPAQMHTLALELYATGNSDAMYMAGLMADPKQFDKPTLQDWVDAAYWYMLSEFTVAWMAAESRFGWELGLSWIGSNKEMTAAAGWATLGGVVSITPDEKLDINALKELISQIAKTIYTAPNRVKASMNNFLIAVSSYVPELTALGRTTARSIGKVTVDMGGTACKVPYAPDYIDKIEKMGRIGRKKVGLVC